MPGIEVNLDQLSMDHPSLPAMPGQNLETRILLQFCLWRRDFKSHGMDLSLKVLLTGAML